MTIGLREIPQHAAAQRVKLFSKQAYIIAAREQPFEYRPSFRIAPLQYVVVD
jgi:hypothetical protein